MHQVIHDHGDKDFRYPFDDLVEDFSIGLSIGLVFCLFALPMVLANPDDTMDFTAVDFTDKEEMTKFSELHSNNVARLIANDPILKERMQGVFEDMMKAKIMD